MKCLLRHLGFNQRKSMFDMKTRSVLPCNGDIGSDNRLPTSKRSHILHNFALYSLWPSKPLLLRSRIIFADSKMIEVIKSPPTSHSSPFQELLYELNLLSKPESAEEHEMNENAESELCFLVSPWKFSRFLGFLTKHYFFNIITCGLFYINVPKEHVS